MFYKNKDIGMNGSHSIVMGTKGKKVVENLIFKEIFLNVCLTFCKGFGFLQLLHPLMTHCLVELEKFGNLHLALLIS